MADHRPGRLADAGAHLDAAPAVLDAARAAGTSRETCTKVLHDYADHGLLRLARGRITVLDPERLKDAAS
ncbi:helix-turn-helix domain-containing protein [Streptomyces sp. NPDC048142]|uniref:helix-turn-helix domain-containing protein n=1 Tax=Streptomyces sp. NPDC048142 TaxID=3365501 RepID=UPI00370F8931